MRKVLSVFAFFFAVATVLYCGLNLAERNIVDLMGLQREPAAFTLKRGEKGEIKLTFAGNTGSFNLNSLQQSLQEWWDFLPIFRRAVQ